MVYDLPVPGPPCKTHRKGSSSLPKASSGRRSARSSAAMRSAIIPQNFFCSGLHALCGSCAAQAATVSGVGVGVDVSAVASNRRGSAWLGLGVSSACGGLLDRNAFFNFGMSMSS